MQGKLIMEAWKYIQKDGKDGRMEEWKFVCLTEVWNGPSRLP